MHGLFDRFYLSCWTIFAAILYVSTYDIQPLWTDEFMTLITVDRDLRSGMLQQQDYAPPLYQLLVRVLASFTLHGKSSTLAETYPVWILRGPALLSAVLTIPAVWWMATTLFCQRIARWTIPIVVLCPSLFRYAREARPYSLFVLLSVISMTCLFRFCQTRASGSDDQSSSLRAGFCYVVSTALMVYAHSYAYLTILAQILFILFCLTTNQFDRQRLQRWAMAFSMILLLTIPAQWLFARLLAGGASALEGGWLKTPTFGSIVRWEVFGEFIFSDLGVVLASGMLCACWLGFGSRVQDVGDSGTDGEDQEDSVPPLPCGVFWSRRSGICLCGLWIAMGVLVPAWMISSLVRPVYNFRYGLPAVIPLLLLLNVAFDQLPKWPKRIVWGLFLMTFLPGLLVGVQKAPGFPELAEWIEQASPVNASQPDVERIPIYVNDWAYTEGFVNPEITGLRFYGTETDLRPMSVELLARMEADILTRSTGGFRFISFGENKELVEFQESGCWLMKRHVFGLLVLYDVQSCKEALRSSR